MTTIDPGAADLQLLERLTTVLERLGSWPIGLSVDCPARLDIIRTINQVAARIRAREDHC